MTVNSLNDITNIVYQLTYILIMQTFPTNIMNMSCSPPSCWIRWYLYFIFYLFWQNTGLATHSITLETACESSPNAAEKQAFVRLLAQAKEDFSDIKVVTTDGHLSIAAYMRNSEQQIAHNQVSSYKVYFNQVTKKLWLLSHSIN